MKQETFIRQLEPLRQKIYFLALREDYNEPITLFDDTLARLSLKKAWLPLRENADLTWWFYKCARNTMIANVKLLGYFRHLPLDNEDRHQAYDPTASTEARADIKKLLDTLSPDEQYLIYEHWGLGTSVPDLQQDLNQGLEQTKSQLKRLRVKLFDLIHT